MRVTIASIDNIDAIFFTKKYKERIDYFMEFHLTPVIKATPETTVVQHLYNTTEERIYGMYFENGTKSVYLKVPYNLTKPIEFFEMRYDTYENKSYFKELEYLDQVDKNNITQLFYTFCHNHTKEQTPHNYVYVHHIQWDCDHPKQLLPDHITMHISAGKSNVYTDIQERLWQQFDTKPVSFDIIDYTPYEQPHQLLVITRNLRFSPPNKQKYTISLYEEKDNELIYTQFESEKHPYSIRKIKENMKYAQCVTQTVTDNCIFVPDVTLADNEYYILNNYTEDFIQVNPSTIKETMHLHIMEEQDD